MTQPEGTVNYTYDAVGFLDSVTDWNGEVTSFGNDADGRVLTVGRANGVDTTHTFDDAGRLTAVLHEHSVSGVVDEFVYTLDPNGNRTGVTSNGGTESYTIDALNRLTAVSYGNGDSEAFGYDPAGNRVSHTVNGGTPVSSTFDAAGQLVSSSDGTTYSYDAAGNLTGSSAGDTYTWDAYSRLTSATVGATSQTYVYDATDVRVSVDGVGQVWDRAAGLPQLISNGSEAFLQPNGHYLSTITGATATYGLMDALGSVRHITDSAGTVAGSTDFSVLGETRTGTVDTFGFTGEQHDPTGLIHLRARQYQPATGRLLSADSVQPNAPGSQGWNLYTYTANNPTTWTDPTGNAVAKTYSRLTVFGQSVVRSTQALAGRLMSRYLSAGPVGHCAIGVAEEAAEEAATAANGGGFSAGWLAVAMAYGCLAGALDGVGSDPVGNPGRKPRNTPAEVPVPDSTPNRGGRTSPGATSVEGEPETYYRAMSAEDFERLKASGDIPATSETFVSPEREYSRQYDGVLVEITVSPGTRAELARVGVSDGSREVANEFPDMPLVSSGWTSDSAYFKREVRVTNIGLGQGDALMLFNSRILGFREANQ